MERETCTGENTSSLLQGSETQGAEMCRVTYLSSGCFYKDTRPGFPLPDINWCCGMLSRVATLCLLDTLHSPKLWQPKLPPAIAAHSLKSKIPHGWEPLLQRVDSMLALWFLESKMKQNFIVNWHYSRFQSRCDWNFMSPVEKFFDFSEHNRYTDSFYLGVHFCLKQSWKCLKKKSFVEMPESKMLKRE